jgi:hypothetical protein
MTADEILAAFADAVAARVVARLGARRDAYTQDALPHECTSRDAYLRRHRERKGARVPGWTCSGKVRAVTLEAWAADVDAETMRARRPNLTLVASPVESVDDQVARELGLKPRSAK